MLGLLPLLFLSIDLFTYLPYDLLTSIMLANLLCEIHPLVRLWIEPFHTAVFKLALQALSMNIPSE